MENVLSCVPVQSLCTLSDAAVFSDEEISPPVDTRPVRADYSDASNIFGTAADSLEGSRTPAKIRNARQKRRAGGH